MQPGATMSQADQGALWCQKDPAQIGQKDGPTGDSNAAPLPIEDCVPLREDHNP